MAAVEPSAEYAEDLALARAVCAGDSAALARFDAAFVSFVPSLVRRIDPSPAFADEVQQCIRAQLAFGEPGRPPRLSMYAGRGPLAAFVRVSTLRIALNLRRSAGATATEESPEDEWPAGADPELDYLKARYRPAFSRAFREAIAGLQPHERTLLRLAHCEGLTLAELGGLERVHLSTVSRRLSVLRQRLVKDTHRLLAAQLSLSADEVSTLSRILRSELDISLAKALQP